MLQDVVIVSATRTPIGKFGGSLKEIPAIKLGTLVTSAAIKKAGLKEEMIDQVIFGNVLQAGLGQNPARQIALNAHLPLTTTAMTINEVCGSGLKALILAVQSIRLGDSQVIVAGGCENMSLAPHLFNQRFGVKAGNVTMVDSLFHDGLTDAFSQESMGLTAEKVAQMYHITREEQDNYALQSQMRATQAQTDGRFKEEITPVAIPQRRSEDFIFQDDEFIRPTTTKESLAKLRPAFQKDGSVTAGNSSGINDGAAAVVLMSRQKAEELGIEILATIENYAEVGIDPSIMGVSPIDAINSLLNKANKTIDDIDLFEINEAFAAQSVAVKNTLEIPDEKINVNGGAIALGHPIGASGARILVTLLHELIRQDKKTGIASLCIGGGLGVSILITRE
ncbi:acetyl-CoA C-acetyltransferase [Granulicatella balaenopterae]|uniref:acetyl-CoA C-acetyltransferase n=1 Tax=Granulicatella balaenopterae TaxID=137733 RepID=A0A1H9I599_9LACT|nr:acetyl-CoA C-acetyltransferase [Granulicatella balaenopterae]SEQ69723.1 acetyl-CoA C-acetyltransferase [Granulicatella balaenopterae]